ncbi:MAG: response regulator [Bradyrhizobium sp.]
MPASPTPQRFALVVDDEPLIRMLAVDMLSDRGFAAYEAENGFDALTVLNGHPEIRLLLTDINMPGTPDGLGLAFEARARRPDLRIIVTSGRVKPALDELPAGGRFISKPYTSSELCAAIALSNDGLDA